MNLQYAQTFVPAIPKINKITALAFSPDNTRLAAVGSDRVVSLFDDSGARRDKFPTKPADPAQKLYTVRALVWAPDSTRIAVAQSDNIVFVYKLAGDKKSICNKFAVTSPVTCMAWSAHQDDVVFGLADGKVRIGHLRNNKSEAVYAYGSMTVSMCASPDRQRVAVGHLDGTLTIVSFIGGSSVHKEKLAQHPCAPTALAFGEMLCAAGNDQAVCFYNDRGLVQQRFDYASSQADGGEREFTVAAASPSGHSVVVASYNRLRVYSYSLQRTQWEEAATIDVPNLYDITALSFRRDGSQLAVGTLCGAVEVYSASIKQYRYQGKFEFTYVSPRQVIVKRLADGSTCMLETKLPLEITKINVYHDNFIVGYTAESLLCADHARGLASEVPWSSSGNDKFIFENPRACMVFNGGELTVVEYGAAKQPLATLRTEYVSVNLVSLRLSELKLTPADEPGTSATTEQCKKVAYMIDPQTIRVEDLATGAVVTTIAHERRIDWLELDVHATKLLFRDKSRMLHLCDLGATHEKVTLLNFCSYVQWVPESGVVVAQSHGNVCVWYNINAPERVTLIPIAGDVVDIVRAGGKTEVVVDQGMTQDRIQLNEGLISFAPSLAEREYERAVEILEAMTLTPEAEAMWHTLATVALQERKLHIAERCYAALNDVARARYLRKVGKIAAAAGALGADDYMVSVKLDVLERQFKKAEYTLLNQGKVDEAIAMYHKLQKYDEAIAVAELKNRPEVDELRRNFLQWLLDSGQSERAAVLKEREGDFAVAVELFLRGGMPARAAQLITDHGLLGDPALLERIAGALFKGGLYEKAGEFFEQLEKYEQALDAYRRGRAYRPAVELSRKVFPERVVPLEDEWAEWLVSQRQLESATHHFVEAGRYVKAVDVAIDGRLWSTAIQLVPKLDAKDAVKYHRMLAMHYEEVMNFDLAEQSYVKGEAKAEAVEMYLRHGMFEKAHAVATTFMDEQEVCMLYINQASRLEGQGRLAEAEKLLTTVGELDVAINMYRKARKFDDMIRLVGEHRRDLLSDTHNAIAEILDNEGHLREAEPHYVAAGRWKSAVNMFRANDLWDDAMRVARQYGGTKAAGQVCLVHSKKLGGEAGVNLLVKHGFFDLGVTLALEFGLFLKAEQIAKENAKARLPDVYLKHAVFLEEEGKLPEAEEEFLRAGNAHEAVLMFTHQQDWLNATRVAESYCPEAVVDILVAQGRVAEEQKDLQRAEIIYIRAKKPELAVYMYERAGLHDSAQRVLTEFKLHPTGEGTYAPGAVAPPTPAQAQGGQQQQQQQQQPQEQAIGGSSSSQHVQAINTYLRAADQDPSNISKAVDVAHEFAPAKLEEVLRIAEAKLTKMGKFGQLAAIQSKVGHFKEAIEAYVHGGMYAEARELAAVRMPEAVAAVTQEQLSRAAADHNWAECLTTAKNESPELLAKYAALQVQELLDAGKMAEACKVFLDHGVVPVPQNVPMYRRLAQSVLGAPSAEEAMAVQAAGHLREVFMHAMADLGSTGVDFAAADVEEFEKLTFIVHLFAQYHACQDKPTLVEQRARVAVSMLRYYAAMPADKAYLLAGAACRDAKWPMMFVLLNRYLDISEAMEEDPEAETIDNSGFENTDVPEELPMPRVLAPSTAAAAAAGSSSHGKKLLQYLPEDKRDDLRSWILQNISTGGAASASSKGLATRTCDCGAEIFEASLWCYSCKAQSTPCIVTGYPVLLATRVTCKSCGKAANKEDWNKFVGETKMCPWCGDASAPFW